MKKYMNRVAVQLVEETATEYAVTGSIQAQEILMQYMKKFDREHLVALLLDAANHIQSICEILVGTLSGSLVHPREVREVFKAAILANASGIILAHNHPSGDTAPSEQDREVTERLGKAGELLGIPVLDHIIVGCNTSYSFREHAQC